MTAVAVPQSGRTLPTLAPGVLAAATVLAQIAYPLVSGPALDALTVGTVVLFAAATLASVWTTRGVGDAGRLLAVAGGVGFAAEALGVATGVPFGHYRYASTLGAQLFGVPLVIPLAWVMMSWPALCVGRRLGHPVVVGALALASWDVFLDPQMVRAGHWAWQQSGPSLRGIPLTNYLGWCLVGLALMAVLDRLLPQRRPPAHSDALPLALWLWTWIGSTVATGVFFGRPLDALLGAAAMATVGVPLIRRLRARW